MAAPENEPVSASVGIASAVCRFPDRRTAASEVFAAEGVDWTPGVEERIGIESVPVAGDQRGSELALAAAREAMEQAGVTPGEIDVIVDYTVLPQEYLVPSWSMSNKLQHELATKKAFTVGFSGGGSTNLHVALDFATGLVRSDERIDTALLLAADVSIPRNRVLNPDAPLTILGDAATAVVVRRDAPRSAVLDTELWSDGARHDVCYIPGGAMAHPDRADLFRMRIDAAAYESAPKMETLQRLTDSVLGRAGVSPRDVAYFVYPNFSAEDQSAFAAALDVPSEKICRTNLAGNGHLQANDLVLNYRTAVDSDAFGVGDLVLLCSHGLGFLSGVSLLRH
jgi:3-oxoacyl-[acyl-carrier-protein] synthase-3